MSAPIAVLLAFALLGVLDKILNNRLGLAEELDKGLSIMGSLAFSMSGIYCASLLLGEYLSNWLATNHINLPFDLSILTSSLLATDMGAYSIASQIAPDHALVILSGILLSSMLGCTISFTLPVALTSADKKSMPLLMQGMVYGIITIPFALLVGSLFIDIPGKLLWANLLPIIIICVLLCISIFKAKDATTRFFAGLGKAVTVLSCILFAVIILEIYSSRTLFIDMALIEEILVIVLKIAVIVCGSFVLSKLVLRYFMPQILFLANKLQINEFAIIGLLLNTVTSISMLAVFNKMDRRGQLMNAACAVSGAYFLGGQLAFVAAVESKYVLAYMVSKIAAMVLAIGIVSLFYPPVEGN